MKIIEPHRHIFYVMLLVLLGILAGCSPQKKSGDTKTEDSKTVKANSPAKSQKKALSETIIDTDSAKNVADKTVEDARLVVSLAKKAVAGAARVDKLLEDFNTTITEISGNLSKISAKAELIAQNTATSDEDKSKFETIKTKADDYLSKINDKSTGTKAVFDQKKNDAEQLRTKTTTAQTAANAAQTAANAAQTTANAAQTTASGKKPQEEIDEKIKSVQNSVRTFSLEHAKATQELETFNTSFDTLSEYLAGDLLSEVLDLLKKAKALGLKFTAANAITDLTSYTIVNLPIDKTTALKRLEEVKP